MSLAKHLRSYGKEVRGGGNNRFRITDTDSGQLHHRQGRTSTRLSDYNPMDLAVSHELNHTVRTELTSHLKQSKWNVPSNARTNCPVRASPHFLQILCVLFSEPLFVLDFSRSARSLEPSCSRGPRPLVGDVAILRSGVLRFSCTVPKACLWPLFSNATSPAATYWFLFPAVSCLN
jgi:hypothetical protein